MINIGNTQLKVNKNKRIKQKTFAKFNLIENIIANIINVLMNI